MLDQEIEWLRDFFRDMVHKNALVKLISSVFDGQCEFPSCARVQDKPVALIFQCNLQPSGRFSITYLMM